jgi:hypothetical protein
MPGKPRILVLLLGLTLVAASLAGCLGETGDPAADSSTPTDGNETPGDQAAPGANTAPADTASWPIEPWTLRTCFWLAWQAQADQAVLEDHLPDGFELDTTQDPLNLGLRGSYLAFQGFVCEDQTYHNETTSTASIANIYTRVHPPENLTSEDIEHFYAFSSLETHDQLQTTLNATGAPVHDGNGTWGAPVVPTPVGPGFGWYMDLRFQEHAEVHVDVSSTHGVPWGEPTVRFYQSADGGVLVWEGTLKSHPDTDDGLSGNGPGRMQIEGGGWVPEAIGGEEVNVVHRLTWLHLRDGRIWLAST